MKRTTCRWLGFTAALAVTVSLCVTPLFANGGEPVDGLGQSALLQQEPQDELLGAENQPDETTAPPDQAAGDATASPDEALPPPAEGPAETQTPAESAAPAVSPAPAESARPAESAQPQDTPAPAEDPAENDSAEPGPEPAASALPEESAVPNDFLQEEAAVLKAAALETTQEAKDGALQGSGAQADPYKITSLQDLVAFQSDVLDGTGQTGDIYVRLETSLTPPSELFTAQDTLTTPFISIPASRTVFLDMNGQSLTTDDRYAGRPIENRGTLTVYGNGTVDSSPSQWGGQGAINNFGVLTIENGTFAGSVYANGDSVFNHTDATLVINGGAFTGSTCALYNDVDATATVNGGRFETTSCNQLENQNGEKGSLFSYCVYNLGTLRFNDGTVQGVQGALAISKGYAEVKGGAFRTVACEHTGDTGPSFYALYVAGEYGQVKAHISGGDFTSASKTAVLVGNDADGGMKEHATAYITGGRFTGGNGVAVQAAANTGAPSITGGVFSSDVSAYVAEGYEAVQADGGWKVTLDAQNRVAQVGGEYFASLQAAVDAAGAGETVTLLTDVDLGTGTLEIAKGKALILDLCGKKISGAKKEADNGCLVAVSGSLTLTDSAGGGGGGVRDQADNEACCVRVNGEGAVLNLEKGAVSSATRGVLVSAGGRFNMTGGTVTGRYGVRCSGSAGKKTTAVLSGGTVTGQIHGIYINANIAGDNTTPYPAEVTVLGSAVVQGVGENAVTIRGNGAVLNVQGGTLTGGKGYGAISGNGTVNGTTDYGGTVINISGGAVKGGGPDQDDTTVYSSNGVYHPQRGVLNITGGNITGETGLEMRAGTLNVSGGAVITGTATPMKVEPNGSGSTTDGAGIAVAQHTTKLPIKVNISGGTISGHTALYESNAQNNHDEDIAKVAMQVTGGSFKTMNGGANAVYSQDVAGFITGGTYTSDVSGYCRAGYRCTGQSGAYTVKLDTLQSALVGVLARANDALQAALGGGKTLAGLTDAELENAENKTKLQGQKAAFTACLDELNTLDAAALESFLANHAAYRTQVEMLQKVCKVALKVAEVAAPAQAQVEKVEVPPAPAGVPEDKKPTQAQADAAKTELVNELTGNGAVNGTPPAGLAEAVELHKLADRLPAGTDTVKLTVNATLTGMELQPVVVTDENGQVTQVELAPRQLVFEVQPVAAASGGTAVRLPVENSQLNGKPITFRLPIPAGVSERYARVSHPGDPDRYPEIQQAGNEKYIALTARSFSPFTVSFTSTLPSPGGGSANSEASQPAVQQPQGYDWYGVLAQLQALGGAGSLSVDVGGEIAVPNFIWQAIWGKNITLTLVRGQDAFTFNGARLQSAGFDPDNGHNLTDLTGYRRGAAVAVGVKTGDPFPVRAVALAALLAAAGLLWLERQRRTAP